MDAERKFLFYHLVIDFSSLLLTFCWHWCCLSFPTSHRYWLPLKLMPSVLPWLAAYLALLHLYIFSYFCLYTSAKFIPGLLPRSYIRCKFDLLNLPYCCWIQASKHRWRLCPRDEVSIYSVGTDPAHGEKHQASNQSYRFVISTSTWF